MLDDSDLISLFFDRDESAINESSLKYGNYCGKIAFNILKNPEDCEECLNSMWMRAWNSIPPNRPFHLLKYFSTLTRNIALDMYNAMHSQKRGGGNIDLILDELQYCISDSCNIEDELIAKETASEINKFVRSLTQPERSIFVRRYYFADPVKEISKVYGLSPNHVSVMLRRSREKLKNVLQKESSDNER